MDITSVEFYTIAFVVAMALIALLMGRKEKQPPSTFIVQLDTCPDDSLEAEDAVIIEGDPSGALRLRRTGFTIGPEETVNLVITVQEDHCSIVEKKGKKKRGSSGQAAIGEAVIKGLRYGTRYHLRYESQLTSTWATFTLDTSSPVHCTVKLKF